MNLKHLTGKYLDEALQAACRLRVPGTRYIRGRYWPFDINKLYVRRGSSVRLVVDAGDTGTIVVF